MLSKSQISFVKSLHQKKYRLENGLFIIEGIKSINEFILSKYKIHSIYATPEQLPFLISKPANIKLFEVNHIELEKISVLQNPQGILALVYIPQNDDFSSDCLLNNFSLVLDGVQDPGNLGTIIRTADWFGLKNVICSPHTVEVYNPKTVQATMGSLCRVNVFYTDLEKLLTSVKVPVFGALLDGQDIYTVDFKNQGIILLGNEGNGISEGLKNKISTAVTIPKFGQAESLNVAVSAAIFCSELVRK
ncbi:MAG: RNA methyltransferase [Sphingobacteriaceae bacterium]|nr:RNA methyltransferase [Sphingobacteriaceae bacterium]